MAESEEKATTTSTPSTVPVKENMQTGDGKRDLAHEQKEESDAKRPKVVDDDVISIGSFDEFDDIECSDTEDDANVVKVTPAEFAKMVAKSANKEGGALKEQLQRVKVKKGTGVGVTGPISYWRTRGAAPSDDFSSPSFDPKLLKYEQGKPLAFQLLSDGLTKIEERIGSGAGSGKFRILVLTNIFRTAIYYYPSDLICILYILIGKIGPDFEKSEIGIGDSTITKAVCEAFGQKESTVKSKLANGAAKDLGEVALIFRMQQKTLKMMKPQRLLIGRVFKDVKEKIALLEGKGSNKTKMETMQRMLVASQGDETKYLTRIFQTKLRSGIQNATLMHSLSYAFSFTSSKISESRVQPETEQSLEALEIRLVNMERAVRRSFSEMPDYGVLVKALLAGRDASNLQEVCKITPAIPVKPMLAKPTKGIHEILDRFNNINYTAEYKYDGERAQIHVVTRKDIRVYSRNSEDMTQKYPDVLEIVKAMVEKTDIKNCIIDSEVVGYDTEQDKILPFQVLANRPRKNSKVEDLKVQVCLFAFDLVYINDEPLVTKTFRERRARLRAAIPIIEKKFVNATSQDFEASAEGGEEPIHSFLNDAIEGSCEGLMLKTLDDNATYEPSRRSLNWLKLKKDYLDGMADSIDVIPVGAWYGKGKRSGTYGAFLLAVIDSDSGDLQTVCKAGTGFKDEDLNRHFHALKDRVIQTPIPHLSVADGLKPDVWFDPSEVWEIIAADLSLSPIHTAAFSLKEPNKGISLRFPRFIKVRDDKGIDDASTADQLVDFYEKQAVIGGGGKKLEAMDDD